MKTKLLCVRSMAGAIAAGAIFIAGCEGNDKGDSSATVGIDFSGTYKNGGASITTPAHPDGAITEFSLTQTGTALQATDNAGAFYEGSLGEIPGESNTEVPFKLLGSVTNGARASIQGKLRRTATTSAEMSANWIEPSFTATLLATAQIVPVPVVTTNTPVTIVVTNEPETSGRVPRFQR